MKSQLEKFSFGIGDRFGLQAGAQLSAIIEAEKAGIFVTPVWNKSYREHSIIGSRPQTTRERADSAVNEAGWKHAYYVDADHIGLENIDFFLDSADFFTLDVADLIGKKPDEEQIEYFLRGNQKYLGRLNIPGIDLEFLVSETDIRIIAHKYLTAVFEAGKIYRHIATSKDPHQIIIEVSMDETENPQTPLELFFILSALSMEKIPLQTIAPKFSGRFNKGVDYVGDMRQFHIEFEQDLAALKFAIKEFDLPKNLKLSVHSGSDKFSIYPIINEALKRNNSGLHLKTAGTTWLEEIIGLAESGGEGLQIVKNIYEKSLEKYEELTAPYASVIEIDRAQLPAAEQVNGWTFRQFVNAVRHDQANPEYNLNIRQLLHVGYKIASDMEERYTDAVYENQRIIAKNVKENILKRHIEPIFSGLQ